MMCQSSSNGSLSIRAKIILIFVYALCIFLLLSEYRSFAQEFSGHWKSDSSIRMRTVPNYQLYLDIDICDNGDFSGILGYYYCIVRVGGCSFEEDFGIEEAFGHINFDQDNGTITYGDRVENQSLTLVEKYSYKLTFEFGPNITELSYEGEAGEYCDTNGGNNSNDNGDDGGDGSGGGCLISFGKGSRKGSNLHFDLFLIIRIFIPIIFL